MKLTFIVALAVSVSGTAAFQVSKVSSQPSSSTSLFSTVNEYSSPSVDVSTTLAKTELLETAESLKSEFGCLLIDTNAQEQLREAVEKLESLAEPPSASAELLGDWTLLCSTASASLQNGPLDKINGIDTSKIPFFNDGPIKAIRDTLNKSLQVQQLVKAESIPGIIDRVDHVLQYMPPDTLASFLNDIPDALKSLNINPLEVTQSKVVLKHKAEVESVEPTFKTKLSLDSIVVNVAGKSQVLDPEGADVLGINVPFGEFLNAGGFETTYLDDKIRISRSKVGIVDQLRVFVRTDLQDAMETDTLSASTTPAGQSTPIDTTDVNDDDTITDADIVSKEVSGNDDDDDDNNEDDKDDDTEEEEEEEESHDGADGNDVSPSDY